MSEKDSRVQAVLDGLFNQCSQGGAAGVEAARLLFELEKYDDRVQQWFRTKDVPFVDIVFDRLPGPVSPRFIDVEDPDGASVSFGEWETRVDGSAVLRIGLPRSVKSAAPSPAVMASVGLREQQPCQNHPWNPAAACAHFDEADPPKTAARPTMGDTEWAVRDVSAYGPTTIGCRRHGFEAMVSMEVEGGSRVLDFFMSTEQAKHLARRLADIVEGTTTTAPKPAWASAAASSMSEPPESAPQRTWRLVASVRAVLAAWVAKNSTPFSCSYNIGGGFIHIAGETPIAGMEGEGPREGGLYVKTGDVMVPGEGVRPRYKAIGDPHSHKRATRYGIRRWFWLIVCELPAFGAYVDAPKDFFITIDGDGVYLDIAEPGGETEQRFMLARAQ